MEAATTTITWRPHLPALSGPAQRALRGRVALLVVLAVVLGALALFARPGPGQAYDPAGAGFTWTAIEPDTGRPVSRAEWITRAS